MDDSFQEVDSLASVFYNGFSCNHMILFVGKGMNEDLKGGIVDLPWSCVLTTRTDAPFSSLFCSNARTPMEYCDPREIPARPLNKEKLPILRLFGVDGQEDQEAEDSDEFLKSLHFEVNTSEERAVKMMSFLPGLLDCVNQLIVIGYRPDIRGEFPLPKFAEILVKNIPEGNVQFWGMDAENENLKRLEKVAEYQHFGWHTDTLTDIVKFRKSDCVDNAVLNLPFRNDDVFYKGGNAAGIASGELLRFQHVATLLTEQTVYAIRPQGRINQARWFYNFLTFSSTDGPQWYGYLPKSKFYVKRSFEDTLVQLVRKTLDGSKIFNQEGYCPIILEGDPGSSKSITLGALAYRIYNEHINPVIFVHNDTLLFSNGSPELDDLDELMQIVEQSGGADTRILVIWDCSSYRTGSDNAKLLAKRLEDRGRRFTLVCSAYRGVDNERKKKERYYRLEQAGESLKVLECKDRERAVVERGGCYYVYTKRDLDIHERSELLQKFREYSGIDSARLNLWFKKLEEDELSDIFMYFYKLVSLLRPNLESGLSREQRKVSRYVSEQLDKVLDKNGEEKERTSMEQAFLNAGIDFEELGISVDIPEDDEYPGYDLERFNTCIALFSRFKIETPYSLAIQMLMDKKREDGVSLYNSNGRELFKLVTTKIPWLRYGESENGNDFTFRFRNTLEAEIFLMNKQINGRQQVELVCDMLDIYGRYYKEYNCIDETLALNLQLLLRLMGPNSRYPKFQENSSEHREILQNLEQIIQRLDSLRRDYNVPDDDASFATTFITFTREYYGGQWDTLHGYNKNKMDVRPWVFKPKAYSPEQFAFRLEKIEAAMEFAARCINRLENELNGLERWINKRRISEQRGVLTVELALCNKLIEQLKKDYLECGRDLNRSLDLNWLDSRCNTLPYTDIFQRLVSVITYDQTNGYAYNALFTAFKDMYNRDGISEEMKLQYLSEIRQIADNCVDIEILNRGMNGRDEISEHLQQIKQYSDKHRFTIDDIHNPSKTSSFYSLYNRMLKMNNPAAITFVCQQELEAASIQNTPSLSEDQIQICDKVRNFMREEENMECVANSPYALSLLLRVSWMCYNKAPLSDYTECQLTRLTIPQWSDIEQISSMYCDCVGQYRQPIIVLIHALATLHTTKNYIEVNRIIESLSEEQFYTSARMRVPYMVCDEEGRPFKYSGTVISVKDYNGFIRISGIPERLGSKVGVRFHRKNLGRLTRMPGISSVLSNLELGVGYTGFSVYTEEGRKARGEKK